MFLNMKLGIILFVHLFIVFAQKYKCWRDEEEGRKGHREKRGKGHREKREGEREREERERDAHRDQKQRCPESLEKQCLGLN